MATTPPGQFMQLAQQLQASASARDWPTVAALVEDNLLPGSYDFFLSIFPLDRPGRHLVITSTAAVLYTGTPDAPIYSPSLRDIAQILQSVAKR